MPGRSGSKLHSDLLESFLSKCSEARFRKFKTITLGSIHFSPDIFCYKPLFATTENVRRGFRPQITDLRGLSVIIGEVVVSNFAGFPDPKQVTEIIKKKLTAFEVMGPGHTHEPVFEREGLYHPPDVNIFIHNFLIQQNGFFQCEFGELTDLWFRLNKEIDGGDNKA
jgi:hypothetical protein